MSQASDYLEDKLLDHVLRNTAFTSPTTVYVGLFTAVTNLENNNVGSASEVANSNGYARVAATFSAASSGSITTSGNITFAAANGGDFGTITHIAILDSNTHGSGNVLFYGALTTSKTIQDGDTFQITTGNLTVTLD